MTKWMIALALVAGCSKKGGSDACADAVNKAVDQMMGRVAGGEMPEEAKAAMKSRGDDLKKVIINRCTQDKWAPEVIDCYAKAASRPDIMACRAKLPPEQGRQLMQEEMQVMMSGGGMGMAPHGDTPPPVTPPPGPGAPAPGSTAPTQP
jgi:hypothetical protein